MPKDPTKGTKTTPNAHAEATINIIYLMKFLESDEKGRGGAAMY